MTEETITKNEVATRRLKSKDEANLRRVLQNSDVKLPEGCTVENSAKSDDDCEDLGSNISYKCEKNKYVCCNKKKGDDFDTESNVGVCTRNDGGGTDAPTIIAAEYDPVIYPITAQAEEVDCDEFGQTATADEKCLLMVMFFGGDSTETENFIVLLDDAIDTGDFETELVKNGATGITFEIIPDPAFTVEPTTEDPPESPTTSPTDYVDPCPDMSGDCRGCIETDGCLWCLGSDVCYNEDDKKRAGGPPQFVSRFLQADVCDGTPTSRVEICDITPSPTNLITSEPTSAPTFGATPASFPPTGKPTVQTTVAPETSPENPSGAWSLSTRTNAIVSGFLCAILLQLLA